MRHVRVQANFFDRMVEYVDPVRARKRMAARAQLALAGQWVGGSKDSRSTKHWNPGAGSADEDAVDDLPVLRVRSRDLQRRNPIALGSINTNVTSVVGTGLSLRARPDAKALGITPDAAQEWRSVAEREFRLWAENPVACDVEATLDFYFLQGLMFRSALESGDVFATLPMIDRSGSVYGLKVQVIEADRVCNQDYAANSDTLFEGVERDPDGAPKAYHVAKQHPGSLTMGRKLTGWDVIPAFGERTGRRNVIHLYDKRRPGLTRGMPYLAPVIEMLKQISDYTHAELAAAVIASLFTVFVKTDSGSGLDLDASGASQLSQEASGSEVKLGAAAIIDLAKNESIEIANPGRPNQAADVFLQAMMRQLGTALELPYEILVKHFTASYSAARAALLEAWRFFKVRRAWLALMFCQPVYEAWLDEAVARGRVQAPGYFEDPAIRAAWCGSEWIGDGPGQIDPLKEINAAKERIAATVSNRTIETMELRGMDWLEVHEQLAAETALMRKIGTYPVEPPRPGDPPVPDPEDEDLPDKEAA